MKFWPFIVILATGLDIDPEPDYGRKCLAMAEYTEAAGEGRPGMAMVAQTVLNRLVHDEGYGQSICEVVQQSHQFYGVENWNHKRDPSRYDKANWDLAWQIADEAVSGTLKVDPKCGGALYFNSLGGGGKGFTNLCTIGRHTFYTRSK